MLSVLSEIKALSEEKNNDKSIFLEARALVKVHGSEVHSADFCELFQDASPKHLTIGEILELAPDCKCLNSQIYLYQDGVPRTPEGIASMMKTLRGLLDCDKFTAPGERTFEEIEILSKLIAQHVIATFIRSSLTMPVMDWLHKVKGYPQDPDGIIDLYIKEVKKIHEPYLFKVLAEVAEASLPDLSYTERLDQVKKQYAKENASPARSIRSLTEESVHEIVGGQREAKTVFNRAVVYSALKNADNLGIVALIPLLANAALNYELVEDFEPSSCESETTPSAQTLMTAQTLHYNGMSLEEAIRSAEKLS